jgi:nickel-dependent lactate racemase
MQVKLAYGRHGLWVDLPGDAQVIEPRFAPGLPDEPAALRAAMASPLGTPPLAQLVTPHDTVAIVFSDITRPMPNDRVLPVLLDELGRAGVPDAQITLINGLGTHRVQTDAELRAMLTDDVVNRYRIVQHDGWDTANLVPCGMLHTGRPAMINRQYMEASVRILTGFIEPHVFAGFSGGPKAVLPGIASIETVLDNHSAEWIAHPKATFGITEGNPIWEEMRDIALSTRPTFTLNVALNRERQITGVFAGELMAAHTAGKTFVRETAMRLATEPFDIVITTNSGYPLDLNLYQSSKGVNAAGLILKPEGDIIMAIECSDGLPEHGQYRSLLHSADSPAALLEKIKQPNFRVHDQWTVQVEMQQLAKSHVHIYTEGLSDEDIIGAFRIPCHSIEETVAEIRRAKPGATIAVLPEGPQTIPYLKREE